MGFAVFVMTLVGVPYNIFDLCYPVFSIDSVWACMLTVARDPEFLDRQANHSRSVPNA